LPAEENTRTKGDTYRITLGGTLNIHDTDIEINPVLVSGGISINLEDDLNFDEEVNFGWVGGYWRLTGGIYILKTDFKVDAAGIIAPVSGKSPKFFQADYSNIQNLDAPLPLFGVNLQYQITSKWNLVASARYLAVEIGDYDGRLTTLAFGADFFSKRFGVGASLGSFDLNVKANKESFNGELSIKYKGAQVLLVYRH